MSAGGSSDSPALDRVAGAVAESLSCGERGVQIAAMLGGSPIVDACGGDMGDETQTPVGPNAMFPIFSVSKAVTAIAVHVQVERGLLSYDAPLTTFWPEYGARGKDAITVAHVLAHRAGVPQMPDDVTPERMCDWDWMIERLAEVEALYPPGTRNAYHSMTFGWLLGEVVRRTDPLGRSFAQFVHEEICGPLGMERLFFGVPAELEQSVATLSSAGPAAQPATPLVRRAVPAPVALAPEVFNRADVRRAVIPAVGAVANAHSVVRLFAMLAGRGELDGVRLLSEERVLSLLEARPAEPDEIYGRVMPVGVGALWLAAPGGQDGGRVLSHTAAGGTLAWADVDSGLAVAFCHNRMGAAGLGPLARAVHAVADGSRS
jgi:CubicO group peptidase (beta-lactamase class C family)